MVGVRGKRGEVVDERGASAARNYWYGIKRIPNVIRSPAGSSFLLTIVDRHMELTPPPPPPTMRGRECVTLKVPGARESLLCDG